MTARTIEGFAVNAALADFVDNEALPGTGLAPDAFWSGFVALLRDLTPKNRALLAERDRLQAEIDAWEREHRGRTRNPSDIRAFLERIGYLVPEGAAFAIDTQNVDDEVARMAGPQLVVPVTNARYALNAANARWGSLYDALYGTDAIPGERKSGGYDATRGAAVIARAKAFLDEIAPLRGLTHADATGYRVKDARLVALPGDTPLVDPDVFAGFVGEAAQPSRVLLRHHGLHAELVIDRAHPIGRTDPAGLADVQLESALTAIMDGEDSVATVDAADKIGAYRNWLGLMTGDLADTFEKSSRTMTRRLNADRVYTAPSGGTLTLPGRALMLTRNVGHLMTNPAIHDADGREVPEGLMDAMITSLIALHDLRKPADAPVRNSRTGSIYVVKPKMHGPA